MAEVWFIRHGESLGNAGHVTDTRGGIPLSEQGHRQAQALSQTFTKAPDLVVVTPYLRTQQTAEYTLARFPDVRREVWNLQEFSCLSDANYIGTTQPQRQPLTQTYWSRRDPDYVDGAGAESFNMLTARINDALTRLQAAEEDFIAVFAHGRVMHTLRFLLEKPELAPPDMMTAIQDYALRTDIDNCSIIRATADADSVRLHEADRRAFHAGFSSEKRQDQGKGRKAGEN